VQPIVTALFANSPFKDGKLNNYKSYRSEVWKDTDPDRTGILPFVFKDNMGYESYVNYALEVPMYFIYRDGNYIDLAGSSFKDFIEGKLDRVSNYSASIEDWELHLTTIFPEVRLKTYLEMRGADAGGVEEICSLSAFWTGLLYDNNSLNKAEELFNDIDVAELAEVRDLVPKEGLNCVVGKYNVYNLASEVIELSLQGLKNRNKLDIEGNDETKYLRPIIKIMKDKENSADKLIRKYNSEWNKDIMKIYEECVF
jgi:glutamate--cysteine ligase